MGQHCECINCHQIICFKMVNHMLYEFHLSQNMQTHTHTHTHTHMHAKVGAGKDQGIKENLLGLRYRGKSRYSEVREIGMFSVFVDLLCSRESEHREYIYIFSLIYTHVLIKGN